LKLISLFFVDFLVLLFLVHALHAEDELVESEEVKSEQAAPAGFMGMQQQPFGWGGMDQMMGGGGMNMNPMMMDPSMMGGMNPMMMDPSMMMNGMNPMMMNQMMMDPSMMMNGMNPMMMNQMMGGGGMNPMMMDPSMMMGYPGMNQMMNPMGMYSINTEDEDKTDVDSAQFMMMPMGGGGGCQSTCGCRQRCRTFFWLPCEFFISLNTI
jgi:hypothetical protein